MWLSVRKNASSDEHLGFESFTGFSRTLYSQKFQFLLQDTKHGEINNVVLAKSKFDRESRKWKGWLTVGRRSSVKFLEHTVIV